MVGQDWTTLMALSAYGTSDVVAAGDGSCEVRYSAILRVGMSDRCDHRLFEVGDGGRWIYRFPTNPTLLLLF
jgi:hypothetical protein